jgi:hypothetical protein
MVDELLVSQVSSLVFFSVAVGCPHLEQSVLVVYRSFGIFDVVHGQFSLIYRQGQHLVWFAAFSTTDHRSFQQQSRRLRSY